MKNLLTRCIRNRYGFTLIELLVVIAIIAILAAAVMSAGGTAINQAKKVKAANTATQIQTAALSYYTEYSVYPTPSGATGDWLLNDKDSLSSGAGNWGDLATCLSGMIHPSTGLTTPAEVNFGNSRQIAFLNLKASEVGNGTTGNADAPLNPLQPMTGSNGKYFNIAVDGDYDGVVGTGSSTVTSMPNFNTTPFNATTGGGSTTAGVAVWANCTPYSTVTTGVWWVHTY